MYKRVVRVNAAGLGCPLIRHFANNKMFFEAFTLRLTMPLSMDLVSFWQSMVHWHFNRWCRCVLSKIPWYLEHTLLVLYSSMSIQSNRRANLRLSPTHIVEGLRHAPPLIFLFSYWGKYEKRLWNSNASVLCCALHPYKSRVLYDFFGHWEWFDRGKCSDDIVQIIKRYIRENKNSKVVIVVKVMGALVKIPRKNIVVSSYH